MMNTNERYMKMAIELAKKADGRTSPNPVVGAVIVKDKRVIAKGFHEKAGLPHAEKIALLRAKDKAKGATLFVSLEPCNHYGRTPPCTEAIIKSGIKKVVIGMVDPNPLNKGKGIGRLASSGIETKIGVLAKEAESVNRPYIKFITKNMPYVTIKVAQSIDGKIATKTGDSRWVSSPSSRALVHVLRSKVDAILVGVNTVLRDNPMLTVRAPGITCRKRPVRIVVDSMLRTPIQSRVLKDAGRFPLIIATTKRAAKKKIHYCEKRGAEVITVEAKKGRVNLRNLFKKLAERGIVHLLVEGGGDIIASILEEKLADRMLIFVAPKIIGGKNAPTSVGGKGITQVRKALPIRNITVRELNGDFLLEGEV